MTRRPVTRALVPEDIEQGRVPIPLRPLLSTTSPSNLDPLIIALLFRLPMPGSHWPEAERRLWLETLNQAFQIVYRDDR